MIAKCSCQFCGINIEFDTQEYLAGSTIVCPTCGRETALSVSKEGAPAKPEVFALDVRLSSGAELRITAVRLYEECAVAKLNSRKAEAMKLLQGVSTGIGAIGPIEWVLAASVVIGAAEAALSAGASSVGLRVLQEAIQLERRLSSSGAFIPVGEIQQIEIPSPGLWRSSSVSVIAPSIRTFTGDRMEFREPPSELIHNGSDFISVMTDDGATSLIRWSSVERFSHRKIE
jgi:hypothetical protein